jgi:STE24 endopeptidase
MTLGPKTAAIVTRMACLAAACLMLLLSTDAFADVAVPLSTPSSIAFDQHREPLWLASQLIPALIAALFLFTGLGARLRTLCARIVRGNWFWTLTLFACAYVVLAALITAPFDYYRQVLDLRVWGQSHQSPIQWLVGETVAMAVKLVIAGLFIWIPYALIARSPRRWWLYSALALLPVAFLVLVAMPIWVSPLTTNYKPLVDKSLAARIDALAARCGVFNIPVFVGGNEDTVVGLGPTNRIVLDRDIFKTENPDQIEFTVGHELKHYIEKDNWKALAIIFGLMLSGFFLTDRLGRYLIARRSQRFGLDTLTDPASLPLIILLLSLFWLAVSPAFNLFARHIETEADRFGLELTHENQPMGEIFANYVKRDGELSDWSSFFLAFRATHPSNADRIRFSNTYRPWAKGEPLQYEGTCKPAGAAHEIH